MDIEERPYTNEYDKGIGKIWEAKVFKIGCGRPPGDVGEVLECCARGPY